LENIKNQENDKKKSYWKNKDQNCIKIQVKLNVEGQNWKKKKTNQEKDNSISIKRIRTKNELK
jgi:hypothetical protein